MQISIEYDGKHFFVVADGRRHNQKGWTFEELRRQLLKGVKMQIEACHPEWAQGRIEAEALRQITNSALHARDSFKRSSSGLHRATKLPESTPPEPEAPAP